MNFNLRRAVTYGSIALMVVLGCEVWWFLAGKNQPWASQSTEQGVAQRNEVLPSNETAEELDTTDWLTYQNEEFGFEFKYPTGWSVEDQYGEPDPSLLEKVVIHDGGLQRRAITVRVYSNQRMEYSYSLNTDPFNGCQTELTKDNYIIHVSCWNINFHPELEHIYKILLNSLVFH